MGAGAVVAIGGSEDKTGSCEVLAHLVCLTRAARPTVAVIAAASEIAAERVARYRDTFTRVGAGQVLDATPVCERDAARHHLAALVAGADLVFLTGGNQRRLMSIVAGSWLEMAVRAAHRAGAVVAGTSAGASALSGPMIAGDDPTPARGLGLLPQVVVDQHFTQRDRLGRLRSVISRARPALGLGVDEDTAAVVTGGQVSVVGSGTVTVLPTPGGSAQVLTAGQSAPLADPGAGRSVA